MSAAEFLLKFNLRNPQVTNRPINWSIVESMSRQILNHHFRNTGEPLLFTDTGDGIDLQHRCYAVLKAVETGFDVFGEHVILDHLPFVRIDVGEVCEVELGSLRNSHDQQVIDQVFHAVDMNSRDDGCLVACRRIGRINKALSKLEINDEYKTKRQYYDSVYETISTLFKSHRNLNVELGEKRVPLYSAAALKMFDIDREKGMTFMEAFFNPLENSLPKGNPVDALRSELVNSFAAGQRDATRPIYIRRAMLFAFDAFLSGETKTKWPAFMGMSKAKDAVKTAA